MLQRIRRHTTACYFLVSLLVGCHLGVLAQAPQAVSHDPAPIQNRPTVMAGLDRSLGITFEALTHLAGGLGAVEAPLVKHAPASSTPARSARRDRPEFEPPPEEFRLSVSPEEEELERAFAFSNRLIPAKSRPEGTGRRSVAREDNEAVATALNRFANREKSGDVSALEEYLRTHPESPWAPSIGIATGAELYRTGRFSQAIETWETAWNKVPRGRTDKDVDELREQAAFHLLDAYKRFQKRKQLETLLQEIEERGYSGRISERVNMAREALWYWDAEPAESMLCGPLALLAIDRTLPIPIADVLEALENEETAAKGLPMNELEMMANDHGWNSRVVFAEGQYEIPVPSVVHLGLNHYSAIIAEDDGRYILKDDTLDFYNWVSAEDIRSEASGYFLVPTDIPFRRGFREVLAAESASVFGKCHVHGHGPNQTKPCDPSTSCGMPTARVHLSPVSLGIVDTPIWYTPPYGPSVYFTVRYNQRETEQPETLDFSNFGALWTHDFLSYAEDDPLQTPSAWVRIYIPGGGSETYFWDPVEESYGIDEQSHARLVRVDSSTYERIMPGGAKLVYYSAASGLSPRRIFLSEIVDNHGNTLSFLYDSLRRLVSITDAAGQVTLLGYNGSNKLIESISDPFGREAVFGYTDNKLTSITDMGDLVSTFTYTPDTDELSSMTTPYGKTTFELQTGSEGGGGLNDSLYRVVEITDPMGDKERVEFRQPTPAIADIVTGEETPSPEDTPDWSDDDPVDVRNSKISYRNTFYWDKKAMRAAPGDYTQAMIYHWATSSNYKTSGVIESVKAPFTSRVWYNYPGQPHAGIEGTSRQPSKIFRMVEVHDPADPENPDVEMQLSKAEHNELGAVTRSWDPMGRLTEYIYSEDMIDLLEVRRVFSETALDYDLLMRAEYNAANQPLKIWSADGHLAGEFTYNGRGQIETATNAEQETTTFTYYEAPHDLEGYLKEVEGPVTGTKITFDDYFRYLPSEITDHEGYTIELEYDDFDRVTKVTYPDETFTLAEYDRFDLVRVTDVTGRSARMWYNDVGQLVMVRDPQGLLTQFSYCKCGALKTLIDPVGNITSWSYDVMGRTTSKTYQPVDAMSPPQEILYAYEALSGRLKYTEDNSNNRVHFDYGVDSSLMRVQHTDDDNVLLYDPLDPATLLTSVPTVLFEYEDDYGRLESVEQVASEGGIGLTSYTYHPFPTVVDPIAGMTAIDGAGMLASVNGPLTNDTITYVYDELGRIKKREIDGANNSTSVTYDNLGRVTEIENELDTFTFNYVSAISGRLASLVGAGGFETSFDYEPLAVDDFRLTAITNEMSSVQTSKHEYDYDPNGLITQWVQQDGSSDPLRTFAFEYDRSDRLIGATRTTNTSTDARHWNYAYDRAGNRTIEQILDVTGGGTPTRTSHSTTAEFNKLNQIMEQTDTGMHRVSGTLPGLGKVKARVDSDAWVPLPVSDPPGSSAKPFAGWVGSDDGTGPDGTGPIGTGSATITVVSEDYATPAVVDDTDVTMTVVAGANKTFTYDDNGNTTSITDNATSQTTTFIWDAADQLRRIEYQDGTATEIQYDAMGRRMRIIEFNASEQETSNKYFLWDGLSIAEEREGTPPTTVTRRYYAQGEIRDGVKYYYGRDHLGSVRDVVDESTGNVVARFDYDPYGRREQTVGAGTFAVDWGFTGHYFHEASGLHLAPFRAYAAELGRWLSRDPIGESGGLNIYEYVLSNPINFFDPLGLDIWDYIAPEWLINQHTADFSAGVGDTLSFGLTRYIRKWGQFDDVVNPCSWAYTAGEITGAVVATTAGGAGIVRNALSVGGKTGNLGQRLLRGGTRLFHDPRQFDTIRKQYWAYNGGARNLAGDVARHLHHWIIPQRAGFGFNASLNLLELPARLNSLMNGRGVGLWIERALRYGILGSLPTSAGLGMRWGLEKKAWRDEWGC